MPGAPQIMAQNLRQRSSKGNLKKAISRGTSINDRSDGEHSGHLTRPRNVLLHDARAPDCGTRHGMMKRCIHESS